VRSSGVTAPSLRDDFVTELIARRYMVVVLAALAALLVCALAVFSAWSATIALGLGKFTNRNGIEISRRETRTSINNAESRNLDRDVA
jgi:hypothetical protein